jgi:hypothetical protein
MPQAMGVLLLGKAVCTDISMLNSFVEIDFLCYLFV